VKRTLIAAVLSLAPAFAAAQADKGPRTEEQKTFYALGIWLAQQVEPFGLTGADLKYVQMGLQDAALGKKAQVELSTYGPRIGDLAKARMQAKTDKEMKRSQSFLDKAAKEPGAQKLPSGLVYSELQAGGGASPAAQDTVKALYKGTLVDGTVFDSSEKHGPAPMEFALDKVIPCWTEGIQKMKVGGKARLVCPSEIAYGDRGQGAIPGGAALIFEVELVDIVKKEAPRDAKEFLDKAAKEKGAKAFPSGMIYKEIKPGKGASPKAEDTVKAHYHGTFPDGKVFDSSVDRGQPAEFPLQHVIKCWQEGLPRMKVGGKSKLVCPAAIAYGEGGRSGIPGGSTLIFEVELLDIVKK
jgi:FKBP-type peptidyl-prolyl cis-trans isomerase FkpA